MVLSHSCVALHVPPSVSVPHCFSADVLSTLFFTSFPYWLILNVCGLHQLALVLACSTRTIRILPLLADWGFPSSTSASLAVAHPCGVLNPHPPDRTIWALQCLADWGFVVFHVAVIDFFSNAFKCRYDLGISRAYLATFNIETNVEIGERQIYHLGDGPRITSRVACD